MQLARWRAWSGDQLQLKVAQCYASRIAVPRRGGRVAGGVGVYRRMVRLLKPEACFALLAEGTAWQGPFSKSGNQPY